MFECDEGDLGDSIDQRNKSWNSWYLFPDNENNEHIACQMEVLVYLLSDVRKLNEQFYNKDFVMSAVLVSFYYYIVHMSSYSLTVGIQSIVKDTFSKCYRKGICHIFNSNLK